MSEKKLRRVIGIDCGTALVGWAVLDEITRGKISVIDYGDIRTTSNTKMSIRLKQIYDAMITLIQKYEPTEMAIEELFFFKNAKTVMSVSEARGVISLSGENSNLDVFGYTPLEVKMAITGYGRAEKSQVQKMITKVLHLKEMPKVDDVADALAIAFCHINSHIK